MYRRFGPKGTLILRCSQSLGPEVPLVVWECYLNMNAAIQSDQELCPIVPPYWYRYNTVLPVIPYYHVQYCTGMVPEFIRTPLVVPQVGVLHAAYICFMYRIVSDVKIHTTDSIARSTRRGARGRRARARARRSGARWCQMMVCPRSAARATLVGRQRRRGWAQSGPSIASLGRATAAA